MNGNINWELVKQEHNNKIEEELIIQYNIHPPQKNLGGVLEAMSSSIKKLRRNFQHKVQRVARARPLIIRLISLNGRRK